ncbi:hypothetical protein FA95DRAFT_1551550 [Auriscalpium vulgare]|uniref:Uncharacterized protein n=1 Tax=Auriscalpium vulgare TaxID=40419 RepID=A0ACB8R102_9AGAM|nr:hypothetical protein FA95DRAFT_1551550 [Auriscalpium vulgare]
MPDTGSHEARIRFAMEARNLRMIREGQPHKMHACGAVRAIVTDGISIGHPCCATHNCSEPLANNRHHFCPKHSDEAVICVVADCRSPASSNRRTCSKPTHRALESYRDLKQKAFFQLQGRLKRVGVTQPTDSVVTSHPDDDEDLDHDVDADLDESEKSEKGNRQPKARFGRRKTHNEQLVVCCCGVIAARATMYGAESISGVKDFLKAVYGRPEHLPGCIFYDCNCKLQAHLRKQKDWFFLRSILAVDVFHFKCKHKESDEFCQKHCNPAQWPELSDGEGNWVFNSSAAEQANVWLGGYLAIVREMLAYRFDFFLDEMIKLRNERLVARLEVQGKAPYIVPTVL